jgi:hypothetical protein
MGGLVRGEALGKHHQIFGFSVSKVSMVTEPRKVLLSEFFFKRPNVIWAFRGEPSNKNAMPTAATHSCLDLS